MSTRLGIVSLILGISFIMIGILTILTKMFIQNQCYQLQPNDFYNSTICEKYWKDTDWNLLKNGKTNNN